jgi:hypothetical protein
LKVFAFRGEDKHVVVFLKVLEDELIADVHTDFGKCSTELHLLVGVKVFLGHSERSHIDTSHLTDRLLDVVVGEHLNPGFDNVDSLVLESLRFSDFAGIPVVSGIQVIGQEVNSAGDISVGYSSGKSADKLFVTAEEHVVFLVLVPASSLEVHQDLVSVFNTHQVGDLAGAVYFLNELKHVKVNAGFGGEVIVPEGEVGGLRSNESHGVNQVGDAVRLEVDGGHGEDSLDSGEGSHNFGVSSGFLD